MTRNDDLRSMDDFDAALRRWGGRPPATPPATAADAVAARLETSRRAAPVRRWLAAAALAAVLGALAVLWWAHGRSRAADGIVAQLPPLEENVMVFYLDPDTPVYFVLPPADPQGGV